MQKWDYINMQKWDYIYIDTRKVIDFFDYPSKIKELGEEGWELTGTVSCGSGTANCILIFKRPKQE